MISFDQIIAVLDFTYYFKSSFAFCLYLRFGIQAMIKRHSFKVLFGFVLDSATRYIPVGYFLSFYLSKIVMSCKSLELIEPEHNYSYLIARQSLEVLCQIKKLFVANLSVILKKYCFK